MELELFRHDILQTSSCARGSLAVLPMGEERKTQKVAAGDLSGVMQVFSVKKGEIAVLPMGEERKTQKVLPMSEERKTQKVAAGDLSGVVLPMGEERKTQKVAAGDLSGVMQVFSVKKGEIAVLFKQLPSHHKVTSVSTGKGKNQRDKVFVAAGNTIKGINRKGKEFFKMNTQMTEQICKCAYNTYNYNTPPRQEPRNPANRVPTAKEVLYGTESGIDFTKTGISDIAVGREDGTLEDLVLQSFSGKDRVPQSLSGKDLVLHSFSGKDLVLHSFSGKDLVLHSFSGKDLVLHSFSGKGAAMPPRQDGPKAAWPRGVRRTEKGGACSLRPILTSGLGPKASAEDREERILRRTPPAVHAPRQDDKRACPKASAEDERRGRWACSLYKMDQAAWPQGESAGSEEGVCMLLDKMDKRLGPKASAEDERRVAYDAQIQRLRYEIDELAAGLELEKQKFSRSNGNLALLSVSAPTNVQGTFKLEEDEACYSLSIESAMPIFTTCTSLSHKIRPLCLHMRLSGTADPFGDQAANELLLA
eukprot:gene5508-3728_t